MKLHNCYFTRDRSCWDAVVAMRVGLSGAIYLRSDLRQRYEDLSSQLALFSLSSFSVKVFFMATKRVKGSRQTEK